MKKIILILTVIFLIGCSGTDPNDVTTGGGGSGGGGNCTGTEAGHPNNPGCVVIPPVVTPPAGTAGLTWSEYALPLTPADWGNTGRFYTVAVGGANAVPGHADPISLLSLPLEINDLGRGALEFNIVGNTDNLYLVTETD